MRYLADDGMQGIGSFGEVAEGPDGRLYQYVQGVDGLGNPMGFWKKIKKLSRLVTPIVAKVAPFIPGGAVASTLINQAAPHLRRAGLMGYDGIGALYQAPDGSLYGVADDPGAVGYFAADELNGPGDLDGIDAAELDGMDADIDGMDADIDGMDADIDGVDADIDGVDADIDGVDAGIDGMDADIDGMNADDLNGLARDDAMNGFAADELNGLEAGPEHDQSTQGYVRQPGVNGVDAFVPSQAPATRWFTEPAVAPGIWKPHW